MKTSPIAVLLWIATLGVVAGGAYFVFSTDRDLKSQMNAFRANADSYRSKPAETWDDLKQREDAVIDFLGVALTTGNPGVVPVVRPTPGPGDGGGPVRPVEVNLIPILDNLTKQLETMIKPQPPGFYYNDGVSMHAEVKVGGAAGKVFLYEGLDLITLKGAADQKNLDLIVIHEIHPTTIVVAGMGPQLRSEIEKAKATEQGQGHLRAQVDAGKLLLLDTNEYVAIFKISTGVGEQKTTLEDMISKAVTPDDKKVSTGGPRPAPGAGDTATTELPKPTAFETIDKEEPKPTVQVTESKELEDGSWQLGTDVLNEATFNDLIQYAETSVDANGQPNGLRISSKLPADNSNAAYRMGARAGDVIKSINGIPVRNMGEIRAVVSRQRNEGVTRFVVTGERNGVPQTRTFTAPPLKK